MDTEARRKQLAAAIRRVAAGDRAALRLVYDQTAAKLFGVSLRILKDRSEAEDVLQEVYLSVWRKAGAFDETRASPITWLVALTRNRAIDRLRSGTVARRSEPIRLLTPSRIPRRSPRKWSSAARSRRGSTRVSASSKGAEVGDIRSAFIDGTTYEELARVSGVPLGTMKSTIRRGLAKLRACLER